MWDLQEEELLRELVHEGFSCGRIVIEMRKKGYIKTRNAIIGKCRRLGISLSKYPSKILTTLKPGRKRNRYKMALAKARSTNIQSIQSRLGRIKGVDKAMKKMMIAHFSERPENLKDLSILQPHECRWPGATSPDGRTLFCAEECEGHDSYCSHHAKISISRGHRT